MIKKILLISAMAILGSYIVFAILFLTEKPAEAKCQGVDILIAQDRHKVLTVDNIEKLLKSKKLDPTGKPMAQIDCGEIERCIMESTLIDNCQCYKTYNNIIGIRIGCREPILQAFDKYEREFFIDDRGFIIEGVYNAIYLPVASGNIERSMAQEELLQIALFLRDDDFWHHQIEQIYFTPEKEIILVPRIGNHTIEVGTIENLEAKLDKLMKFYKDGLNKIGWNKYKKLNIEFENKVIGTKK
ncbi:MAG: cell division protein FtsQ [Bacteroidaceae bacterium]|nr:cell division protein FtsQ [Bacteroidaceae bacterium]